MSNILYIGWFGLPETAAGIRVFQIAKLLRESGNNVAFLCLSQPGLKENQEIQYDGFKYMSLIFSAVFTILKSLRK